MVSDEDLISDRYNNWLDVSEYLLIMNKASPVDAQGLEDSSLLSYALVDTRIVLSAIHTLPMLPI